MRIGVRKCGRPRLEVVDVSPRISDVLERSLPDASAAVCALKLLRGGHQLVEYLSGLLAAVLFQLLRESALWLQVWLRFLAVLPERCLSARNSVV